MIAALFVDAHGPYANRANVDFWDIERDARQYAGPLPVVAHPPCKRWGRYWFGGPSVKVRKKLGDDDGCFKSALESVRRWGGVLEHPEASHAWRAFGITKPPKSGGWIVADDVGGWTCCVEQGHYGHRARKATWLYAVGCDLPSLIWGPSQGKTRMDPGFHSKEEAKAARASPDWKPVKRLSARQRRVTPDPFAKMLIDMAKTAGKQDP